MPDVSVPFPSTVLLPREMTTAGEPRFWSPTLLSVIVELDTLSVATPVEVLRADIPLSSLPDAWQFSTLTSASFVEEHCTRMPVPPLLLATHLVKFIITEATAPQET